MCIFIMCIHNSQVPLAVNSLPANEEDARDAVSIPGSGRSPGGEHSENKDHGIWSHRFMGNKMGKQWKQCQTLFLEPQK